MLHCSAFFFTFAYVLAVPAFLQERKQGTLEKTLLSPVHRAQVVFGCLCSFSIFAGLQILLMLVPSFIRIGFPSLTSLWPVFLSLFIEALTGLAVGMFFASIVQNNFQAFQFVLFIIVPQIFLSGIMPIGRFPGWLQKTAVFTPMYNGTETIRSLTSRLPVSVDTNFGYLLLILHIFAI
ncbi:ABC transporter permease [Terrilactibacillus sp. S3-3]|nr:ABC transporter permease [Terrilactibacillus sp. S3-3]